MPTPDGTLLDPRDLGMKCGKSLLVHHVTSYPIKKLGFKHISELVDAKTILQESITLHDLVSNRILDYAALAVTDETTSSTEPVAKKKKFSHVFKVWLDVFLINIRIKQDEFSNAKGYL
jgi:hypothetical protein